MKRKFQPLSVNLLGVNERIRNTFAMVFDGPAKTVARLSENGKADLVIIDADGVGAKEIWQAFHQKHPRCPAIAISAAAIELDGVTVTLPKPIKIDELIDTIRRLAEQFEPETKKIATPAASLEAPRPSVSVSSPAAAVIAKMEEEGEERTQRIASLRSPPKEPDSVECPVQKSAEKDFSAVCGNAEDVDCDDEAQIARLSLPLTGRLLESLHSALNESRQLDQPVALKFKENTLAIFHPRGRAVAVAVSDVSLQRLSQAVFPSGLLVAEKLAVESPIPPGPLAIHPDVLIWKVAAWTYRGQLPVDLPPNKRIYLRHWPNLTRLLELPDAMRIAALLNEQPMSMARVAEALKIPQRHVFAFCACAHSIGLLDVAKRAFDHAIEPPAAPHEHRDRQLLGRIMHYLRGLMS